jgi:hypothetical protein
VLFRHASLAFDFGFSAGDNGSEDALRGVVAEDFRPSMDGAGGQYELHEWVTMGYSVENARGAVVVVELAVFFLSARAVYVSMGDKRFAL